MYIGLHVNYPSLLDFNEIRIISPSCPKTFITKFRENTSNGSRAVPRGRADRDHTVKAKLKSFIATLRTSLQRSKCSRTPLIWVLFQTFLKSNLKTLPEEPTQTNCHRCGDLSQRIVSPYDECTYRRHSVRTLIHPANT